MNSLTEIEITEEKILELLRSNNHEDLFATEFGKDSHDFTNLSDKFTQIISFSNYCFADCTFCNFRKGNNSIIRKKLNREEIIEQAISLEKKGHNSVLLHCGYDNYYDTDRISYIIYTLKKRTNLKIGLSFGMREMEQYRKWKIAGADYYYLNFITSDKNLYKSTKAFGYFEERILHLQNLKKIGYSIGSGLMLGLNNQSPESLAKDIYFIGKLALESIGFCKSIQSINEENLKHVLKVSRMVYNKTRVTLYNFTF